jgi:hypothetical protein
MNWQLPTVLLIVLLASCYLARRAWRTWTARKGACGGGCSCSGKAASAPADGPTSTLIPIEQLTLRRNRLDRP